MLRKVHNNHTTITKPTQQPKHTLTFQESSLTLKFISSSTSHSQRLGFSPQSAPLPTLPPPSLPYSLPLFSANFDGHFFEDYYLRPSVKWPIVEGLIIGDVHARHQCWSSFNDDVVFQDFFVDVTNLDIRSTTAIADAVGMDKTFPLAPWIWNQLSNFEPLSSLASTPADFVEGHRTKAHVTTNEKRSWGLEWFGWCSTGFEKC